MTTVHDLADTFRRLVTALAWLDDQPDGRQRAAGIRTRLNTHINHLCDDIAGRTSRCHQHPGELAHNCRCCRSETIATQPEETA